jgi:hypothetical protein
VFAVDLLNDVEVRVRVAAILGARKVDLVRNLFSVETDLRRVLDRFERIEGRRGRWLVEVDHPPQHTEHDSETNDHTKFWMKHHGDPLNLVTRNGTTDRLIQPKSDVGAVGVRLTDLHQPFGFSDGGVYSDAARHSSQPRAAVFETVAGISISRVRLRRA